MSERNDYREASRRAWFTDAPVSGEVLQIGAQLRAADALEKMAQPYVNLLHTVKSLREQVDGLQRQLAMERRRTSALRGQLTKARKSTAGAA